MSDEKKIKLYIVGIIAVIISIIVILIILWGNFFKSLQPVDVENLEFEVGNFTYIEFNTNDVVKRYSDIIRSKLSNGEIEELYNKYISSDYKEKYSYTLDSFKDNLQKKKLIGNQLEVGAFKSYVINGKKVYCADLKSLDKSTSVKFNIIESKPNDFCVTFDDFLLKDDKEEETIVNGLKLTVSNKEYYTGRIVINSRLENVNNYPVFINVYNKTENAFFRGTLYDSDFTTQSTILSSEMKVLNEGESMNYTFSYNVTPDTYSSFNKLVIKDVKLSEYGDTVELVYGI